MSKDTVRVSLEPRGGTRARVYRKMELGCDHRHGTMWQHGSPPLKEAEPKEPPQEQSHMASREPTSWGGRAKEVATSLSHVAVWKPAS
jgi:hypothetical protein